jgi:hypothetical protein
MKVWRAGPSSTWGRDTPPEFPTELQGRPTTANGVTWKHEDREILWEESEDSIHGAEVWEVA